MGPRNVSIRSLLETSDPKEELPTPQPPSFPLENAAPAISAGPANPPDSVQSLISQYQTSVGFPEYLGSKRVETAPLKPVPTPTAASSDFLTSRTEPLNNILQNYVKKFQIDFQTTANIQNEPSLTSSTPSLPTITTSKQVSAPGKLRQLKPAFALQPAANKHSIDSIINTEDAPAQVSKDKKRPIVKTDLANKKPKTEPKKSAKPAVKPEAKKTTKAKKKTPDSVSADKPSIYPTMTADKTPFSQASIKVPAASFIESDSDKATSAGPETPSKDTAEDSMEVDQVKYGKEEETRDSKAKDKDSKEKEKEKDKEKGRSEKEAIVEVPVIALNIPLLDTKNPQPGQAEVVINVLKLAEDKYGWNTIHPNAKSAIDLMDDILDDDDEGEDEEEEDVSVADEKANPLKKKEELTEEQLIKRHETKMNRKVGKYDYEDPFIDDAELQWEEEITTTKEGFFVYWGPLVEEKSATKKSASKSKK